MTTIIITNDYLLREYNVLATFFGGGCFSSELNRWTSELQSNSVALVLYSPHGARHSPDVCDGDMLYGDWAETEKGKRERERKCRSSWNVFSDHLIVKLMLEEEFPDNHLRTSRERRNWNIEKHYKTHKGESYAELIIKNQGSKVARAETGREQQMGLESCWKMGPCTMPHATIRI